DHIWEEYELTYQTAIDFRNTEFEIDNAQQSISRLKRAINQLGDVNPHAIEEYKEVSARYESETAQCEDLEKGKQDLIDIITELTSEMTSRFNTAFEQININFQTAFRDLFGGGRGKLEIIDSDPDNPLDAGVEIYAQPPGKKLALITLLSGGEKTLTSIAILFAIIKLRPMPFCVLDEIDTALDDANAGLLAQYLKRFSERTQFIVISHRKPTMEISDNIFGVSMEENGISTLLSVNLSEALKFVNEEN
ncbi:MAG: chromosome segregation protein SMC, partial [Clostridia bacterium]